MSRVTVITSGRAYTVAFDDDPPDGRRVWDVIDLSLVDELTGQPVTSAASVHTTYPRLTPRAATNDGLVGLVGIPADAFPGLATTAYDVDFTVTAEGYVPRETRVTIPADPHFPGRFVPLSLENFTMHRPPAVIQGRAVLIDGMTHRGLEGATITLTGVWWNQAGTINNAKPPNLVAVQPPLAFDRTTATGKLRRRTVTPVEADDKTLLGEARRGETRLMLSDSRNLTGSDLLWLDFDEPERMEYVPVGTLPPGSAPDQPVILTLGYALVRDHRPDAPVRRVTPGAVNGFSSPLEREAQAGDVSVFLDHVAGIAHATTVEVVGGPGPRELHQFQVYRAESKAGGYFRLPPIARVAQVEIEATHPQYAATSGKQLVTPRYGSSGNRVDFVFVRV